MATPTYSRLATLTLSQDDSQIDFTSIPSTYQDLILIADASHSAYAGLRLRVNNNSSSLYSGVWAKAYGSLAGEPVTNSNAFTPGSVGLNGGTRYSYVMHFMDYAQSRPKTGILRFGVGSSGTEMASFLWNSNDPITSINLFLSAGSYSAGSSFSLYGIEA